MEESSDALKQQLGPFRWSSHQLSAASPPGRRGGASTSACWSCSRFHCSHTPRPDSCYQGNRHIPGQSPIPLSLLHSSFINPPDFRIKQADSGLPAGAESTVSAGAGLRQRSLLQKVLKSYLLTWVWRRGSCGGCMAAVSWSPSRMKRSPRGLPERRGGRKGASQHPSPGLRPCATRRCRPQKHLLSRYPSRSPASKASVVMELCFLENNGRFSFPHSFPCGS